MIKGKEHHSQSNFKKRIQLRIIFEQKDHLLSRIFEIDRFHHFYNFGILKNVGVDHVKASNYVHDKNLLGMHSFICADFNAVTVDLCCYMTFIHFCYLTQLFKCVYRPNL